MSEANPAFAAIDHATAQAHEASSHWAASTASERARLLRGLADVLEQNATALIALANDESALGEPRLTGELARTAFQLRGFASAAEAGVPYLQIDDAAAPGAPPAGRPRLTLVQVPLGPVAMFSASNFPFAFSVLGGDTASALAAGCPVIVKAHSGHPALSRKVFELAVAVVAQQGLPVGVLTLVEGASREAGAYLVRHPNIAAVAFTGSYQGGVALWRVANERPRPIPFFGELGSINPLVVLPGALANGVAEVAKSLAGSIALGCGQFCTSPGLILVFDDADGRSFTAALADALSTQSPHRMLTDSIRYGFDHAVGKMASHAAVRSLIEMREPRELHEAGDDSCAGPWPRLFEVEAAAFIANSDLHEEMFGPAALVVKVRSVAEVLQVLQAVEGSLTVTLWGVQQNTADNLALIRAAEQIAGRVLFGGVPTGVAVTRAQQHGGPWPASTQPQTTSVGYGALARFLRPVALQDAPDWLIAAKRGGTLS
ncbi:aldehyde dehydrogenase [Paraburkholderia caffeinilytica]|uniref:Fatty aldehyde dehydrogenase n=1 Tax=Paraburkholderia caffeinilytica TaxID=1761016 RepID=A0ABQ1LPD9_9BURK|nr:aldehyde dehydrogenase (NADP(+)) [Paraburkholderia caffeinilytica]AXL53736.1 aldehyde dehydrogenase [Paraburkholderia caffeinilytica]GGC26348.1 fatty aldehyde dehydrogenase [Paraburkholderia caffeinilytica]CAB3807749.1 Alpha-ketoglutaric semialdehyde dehydrogenase 2 [Paraburkholderia caffeinilytica]